MSIEALAWALRAPVTHAVDRAVLIALADSADHNWSVRIDIQHLSDATLFAESEVRESLNRLLSSQMFKRFGETMRGELVLTSEPDKPERKPKRRKRGLPDDWAPDDVTLLWAEKNFPEIEVKDEADHFREYWLANGDAKLDWNMAFRTWVRNAKRFRGTHARWKATGRNANPTALADDNRERIRSLLGKLDEV